MHNSDGFWLAPDIIRHSEKVYLYRTRLAAARQTIVVFAQPSRPSVALTLLIWLIWPRKPET